MVIRITDDDAFGGRSGSGGGDSIETKIVSKQKREKIQDDDAELFVSDCNKKKEKNLHRIVGFDLELFWWAKQRITIWSEMIRPIRLLVGVIMCRTKAPTADTYMHACQTSNIYVPSIEWVRAHESRTRSREAKNLIVWKNRKTPRKKMWWRLESDLGEMCWHFILFAFRFSFSPPSCMATVVKASEESVTCTLRQIGKMKMDRQPSRQSFGIIIIIE